MKKHILLLCGGQSSEHEVSLRSAANVFKALNAEKFEVTIIGIDHQGQWQKLSPRALLEHQGMVQVESQAREFSALTIQPGTSIIQAQDMPNLSKVDVVFPLLHGPQGEDGTVQGLLRLLQLPFIGCDVLASAICMDKDFCKRLIQNADIPMADYLSFYAYQQPLDFDVIQHRLKLPFFVKPANMGSSVGISKVHNRTEFIAAIALAFKHDKKIVIEETIQGREIECAILGNAQAQASRLGEVVPQHEFYSYTAKYLDEQGAHLKIPADLPIEISQKIQAYALQIFHLLECTDLARVDFFVTANYKIYFNEINTMPGFTSISMFPSLWQASGIDYPTLIETLINLAEQRFTAKQKMLY